MILRVLVSLFFLTAKKCTLGHQETSQNQILSGDQGKNIFVQTYEAITNGLYWAVVITILIYLFYLISVRQVDNYFTNNKNNFKRLELPSKASGHAYSEIPKFSNYAEIAEFSNSAESFCTADLDGASTSRSLIPAFALSEDDTRQFRRPVRDVWALSKEPGTQGSAIQILKDETEASRKKRNELENNLEEVLRENEELTDDKRDWSSRLRLRVQDVNMIASDSTSLRERVAALEREERLTKAALKDHKIIQHRLAASTSEIKQLQQQVEELKIEKQTAIELVNKILFRSRFQTRRPLPPFRDSCLDDSLRNYSHHDTTSRDPLGSYSCPDDPIRNYSLPDPLGRSARLDLLRNFSFPEPEPVGLDPFRNDSRAESNSYSDRFRSEFYQDPLLSAADESKNMEECLTPKSPQSGTSKTFSDEASSLNFSESEIDCSQEYGGENLATESQLKSAEGKSRSPPNACSEPEERTDAVNDDLDTKCTLRLRLDQSNSVKVSENCPTTDGPKSFSGSVTSSPQFRQFLDSYCKDAKSQ